MLKQVMKNKVSVAQVLSRQTFDVLYMGKKLCTI